MSEQITQHHQKTSQAHVHQRKVKAIRGEAKGYNNRMSRRRVMRDEQQCIEGLTTTRTWHGGVCEG
jgi:hypothetical protein